MSSDRVILISWALALALITYREFKNPAPDAVLPGVPRPWAYTGASGAFAVAAIIGEINGGFGAILAVAWVIAIFLGFFETTGAAPAAATNA